MKPASGYSLVFTVLVLIVGGIAGIALFKSPWFITAFVLAIFLSIGFFFLYPNGSRVMTLFGEYKGTVKEHGFYWVNPFFVRKAISLRARNFDSELSKVNDKLGNPINISVILVWRVKDTYRAAFEVDIFENFGKIKTKQICCLICLKIGLRRGQEVLRILCCFFEFFVKQDFEIKFVVDFFKICFEFCCFFKIYF